MFTNIALYKNSLTKSMRLCVCLLLIIMITMQMTAFAFAFADDESERLMDTAKIQQVFDEYIKTNDLNPDIISVSYVYLDTGEEWNHNENKWYYSASLYKVPLMMLFAEKEAKGEATQDTEFYSWKLADIEREVLVNSSNDIAYSMMQYLGSPHDARIEFKKFANLPDDYFTQDYEWYSCFTSRFMTNVMKALYDEPGRFPHIADLLKQAQRGHYLELKLGEGACAVAQKYGSFHDEDGRDWNHASGIFYAKHPFIVTVMTRYAGLSENIIGDIAAMLYEHSMKLGEQYDKVAAEKAAQAEAVAEEPTPESSANEPSIDPQADEELPTSEVTEEPTEDTPLASGELDAMSGVLSTDSDALAENMAKMENVKARPRRMVAYAVMVMVILLLLFCLFSLRVNAPKADSVTPLEGTDRPKHVEKKKLFKRRTK